MRRPSIDTTLKRAAQVTGRVCGGVGPGGGGGVDWGRVALLGEISLIFFGPMYSGFGGCVWVFLCPIVDIKLDRSS